MSKVTNQILNDISDRIEILRKQIEAEIRIVETLEALVLKLRKSEENEQHS